MDALRNSRCVQMGSGRLLEDGEKIDKIMEINNHSESTVDPGWPELSSESGGLEGPNLGGKKKAD